MKSNRSNKRLITTAAAVLALGGGYLHAQEAGGTADHDLAMQLVYTTETHTTFSLNTESSYDWENSQWSVPINLGVSQLLKIRGSPLQFQLGGRYHAETPDNGPDWGLRFTVTFLWPRLDTFLPPHL